MQSKDGSSPRRLALAACCVFVLSARPAATQVGDQVGDDEDFDFFSGNAAYSYADLRTYYDERGGPIRVFTSEWSPMVRCEGLLPGEQTGYFSEVFKQTATLVGWRPSDFQWNCTGWDEMIDAGVSGEADVVAGGLEITTELLGEGLQYTSPGVYRSGFRILIAAGGSSTSLWSFIHVFSWELWLAVLLTAAGTGILLWMIEFFSFRGKPTAFAKPGAG